jgi:hypothetical protein
MPDAAHNSNHPTDPAPAPAYSRSPDAEATQAGGRAVIYHRTTGHAITLNETGTLLWLELDTPKTAEHLKALLLSRWPDLATATAESDVSVFLEELLKHELVAATSR